MKKSTITILIVLGLLFLIVMKTISWMNSTYDKAINYQENVDKSWGDVVTQYQRRADLIPNLVNIVKGYAAHEQETLTGVIEARAKATSTTIDASNLTPENMQAFQQAQGGLSSALSKLMVVVERYPDLKANQNFSELQAQLEGTENRISVSRMKYNESVKTYNFHIRGKFRKWALGIFGEEDEFPKREMFEAVSENAEQAPKVEF
ncbi:MAG TPA: LemA family protein [Bacteroidales bacterium]|nr:LemA family protein [Bacteroidales bacterium]